MIVKVTQELLESIKTPCGGWTRRQLRVLGINWPPIKGWKNIVIGNRVDYDLIKTAYKVRKNRKKRKRQRGSCQTKWERKFAKILEKYNLNYKSNPKFKCKNGPSYFPDFLLDCGVIVEIDGKEWHSTEKQLLQDSYRTVDLKKNGIKEVYRLWNYQVTRGEKDPAVHAVITLCLSFDRGSLVGNLLMDCG